MKMFYPLERFISFYFELCHGWTQPTFNSGSDCHSYRARIPASYQRCRVPRQRTEPVVCPIFHFWGTHL